MTSGRKYLGPDPSLNAHWVRKVDVDEAGGAPSRYFLHLSEVYDPPTTNVASTSGSWVTRHLNTVRYNGISGASLSSYRFTLPAGTYFVYSRCNTCKGTEAKVRLYNYSDSSVVAYSQNSYMYKDENTSTSCWLKCSFTITGSKTFELQHIVEQGQSYGFGGGHPTDSPWSDEDVNAEILIEKVA